MQGRKPKRSEAAWYRIGAAGAEYNTLLRNREAELLREICALGSVAERGGERAPLCVGAVLVVLPLANGFVYLRASPTRPQATPARLSLADCPGPRDRRSGTNGQ